MTTRLLLHDMPTMKQKMEVMTGLCSSCGVSILDLSGIKSKKLENYHEHLIKLSNNTLMRVGVCSDCKIELVSGNSASTAEQIIENHKHYWRKAKKAPKEFESITCTDSNTTPQKFLQEKFLD